MVKKNLPYKLDTSKAIWYQDKAPCHVAGKVHEFLKKEFPCFIPNAHMPPDSPGLNGLDHCVWSILKHRLAKYGLTPSTVSPEQFHAVVIFFSLTKQMK
ncbi:hypothetical protein BV898_02085 [Hypsibius exemplaris]|uniref:Tc1-like transposase DDE domain-containing protein n=1 Tax=Hypsibius exemplaris TaxID=2072580 RepID=A0A1W0X9R5_HYPEX|nr:hypothetical protein BV898_02085 [Hypsibius exemplaris]